MKILEESRSIVLYRRPFPHRAAGGPMMRARRIGRHELAGLISLSKASQLRFVWVRSSSMLVQ